MNFSNCTEKELWEYVATHLSKQNINSVLVGGAVAAIYSDGAYKSGDLDIVLENYQLPKDELKRVMNEIGFKKSGRHWIHPECKHLFIEYLKPPVAIGDDITIKPVELKKEGIPIFMLSPTDSVKDRLAGYIHWNARECFDQAMLVAEKNEVNHKEIKKWCESEHSNGSTIYKEFLEKLNRK